MNNWEESPSELPMKEKTRPIHEVRLGAIKAAVWKNDTTNGVRYNVTFSRLYKDGDQWQATESFGRDDLLMVAKVADEAHTWICRSATAAPTQDDDADESAKPTATPSKAQR